MTAESTPTPRPRHGAAKSVIAPDTSPFPKLFLRYGSAVAAWLALIVTVGFQLGNTSIARKTLSINEISLTKSFESLRVSTKSLMTAQLGVLQSQHPTLQLQMQVVNPLRSHHPEDRCLVVSNPAHLPLVDVQAYRYAYRVTWPKGEIRYRKAIIDWKGRVGGKISLLEENSFTPLELSGNKIDEDLFGILGDDEIVIRSFVLVYHRAVDHHRFVSVITYQVKAASTTDSAQGEYITPLNEIAEDTANPTEFVKISRRIERLEKMLFGADDIESLSGLE